jgi:propanediol dehydratase small subunit
LPPGQEVECLIEEIKSQLRVINGPQTAAHAAARRKAMLENVPEGTTVPEDILKATGMLLYYITIQNA